MTTPWRPKRLPEIRFTRHSSRPQEKHVNHKFDCSHAVRLSGRQWIAVALTLLALIGLAPGLWKHAERFDPGPDYRIPYDLSDDYWLYQWLAERVGRKGKIAVVGDSVIWGHYVSPDQTLTHHLNELTGDERFANLGLDGTHPAALHGLVTHYTKVLAGRTVVLHLNPLWITSRKHDLQTTKEFHFNHPKLVPQFRPEIPCYRASLSNRLWAVIERRVAFYSWTSHLRAAYFDNSPPQVWTLEHPYKIPLPAPDPARLRPEAGVRFPATQPLDTTRKQGVAWVELDTSVQWRFFRRSIGVMRKRGADVFVLVGPFNEHALMDEAKTTLAQIKTDIGRWLDENDIPHATPPPLPAGLYVDSSHPTAEGYAMLAKDLLEIPALRVAGLGELAEAQTP
jgi:hypothetical protein